MATRAQERAAASVRVSCKNCEKRERCAPIPAISSIGQLGRSGDQSALSTVSPE